MHATRDALEIGLANEVLDGRFRLEETLGHGAAGAVHRARDLARERDVALKRLIEPERQARRRLLGEYLAMRRISHPHVARAFDWGIGGDYFTMELVRGVAFDRFVRDHGAEASLPVLRDLLDGLATIHAHGLVHLDVKPANLLVAGAQHPDARIIDFGLLRRLGSRIHGATGTPAYAAPEVLAGEGRIDGRADLFSLGVVLLEALTGERIAADGSAALLLERPAWIAARLAGLDGVPAELRRLLEALVAHAPDERPGSALDARALAEGEEPRGRWPLVKPKLVGRADALDELRRSIDAVHEGRAAAKPVIRIVGEPGIGKTRLLDRLEIRLRAQGTMTVRSGWTAASAAPFAPFRGLLGELERQLARAPGAEGTGLRAVGELIDEGRDPQRAVRAVADFVLDAVRALRPLRWVVLLEDAHWAGPIGSRLLEELAERLPLAGAALALVLTQRPDADPRPPRPGTVHIGLGPLHHSAVERMAAGMLTARRLQPEITRTLFQASAGNPLSITEMVRSLVLSGVLRTRQGTAYLERPLESVLSARSPASDGLAAALRERMKLLSRAAQKLVGQAAVLGPRIRYDVLSAVSGLEDEAVIDHLMEAFRLGVMERSPEAGGAGLRFTHERVRELTAESLSADQRRTHHRAAADVLLAIGDDELRADAGVHLLRAGDRAAARDHLVAGARDRSRAARLRESIDLYRMALECPAKRRDEGLVRLALGELLRQIGSPEKAERMLRRGLAQVLPRPASAALLERHDLDGVEGGDAKAAGAFLSALGSVSLHRGDLEQARRRYGSALELHTRAGEATEARAVRVNLGVALGSAGDIPAAIELLDEALSPGGEPTELQTVALINLGHFRNLAGQGRRALEAYREALAAARARSDEFMAATVLGNLGEVLHAMGRLTEALEHHQRALEMCERIGDSAGSLNAMNGCGEVLTEIGRDREALEMLERSVGAARRAGSLALLGRALNRLGEGLIRSGDYERADSELHAALVANRRVGEPGPIAWTLKTLGTAALSAGDLRQAETLLREAGEAARQVARPRIQAAVLHHLARIDALRGDLGAARVGLEEALRLFREIAHPAGEARALLALAQLDETEGKDPDERSAAAVEIARAVGGRALLAQARVARAACLARGGRLAAAEREARAAVDELSGRPAAQAIARVRLGSIAAERGRTNRAERELEAAAKSLGRLGRRLAEGIALLAWGSIEYGLGDDEAGDRLGARARAIFERIGAPLLAERARHLSRASPEVPWRVV